MNFDFVPGVPPEANPLRQLQRATEATMRNLASKIPEGDRRTNADIALLTVDIDNALNAIIDKALEHNGPFFQGQQARDVLDYLKCVHVGLRKFVGDLGLEVKE